MKRIRKSFYGIWVNKVHHLIRIDYSQVGCNGSHAWARAATPLDPLMNARPDASPASACPRFLYPRKSLEFLGFKREFPVLGFIKLYFVNGLERSRSRSIAMRFSLAGALVAARLDLILASLCITSFRKLAVSFLMPSFRSFTYGERVPISIGTSIR